MIASVSDALMRMLGHLLSGSGRSAKLLILAYHRVVPERDPLLNGTVDVRTFEWQMLLLADRFAVLPLTEAVTRLLAGTLPPRTVCITFDDGYADNVSVALPVLRKHDLTAAFFIATDFLDGGRMWNDTIIESVRGARGDVLDLRACGLDAYAIGDPEARRRTISKLLGALKYLSPTDRLRRTEALARQVGADLPNDLMMRSSQVLELQAAGMEIGAHTASHPILTRLTLEQVEADIRRGRERLLELGIRKVDAFAYPNGRPGIDYEQVHAQVVQRVGFKLAVSTAWGCARSTTDAFQLPRIAPWDKTRRRFNLRMLKAYIDPTAVTA
jgi:peptidoglycan/xylan/chitin deacetylase (PgdA/CDA1 family)